MLQFSSHLKRRIPSQGEGGSTRSSSLQGKRKKKRSPGTMTTRGTQQQHVGNGGRAAASVSATGTFHFLSLFRPPSCHHSSPSLLSTSSFLHSARWTRKRRGVIPHPSSSRRPRVRQDRPGPPTRRSRRALVLCPSVPPSLPPCPTPDLCRHSISSSERDRGRVVGGS